MRFGLLVQMTGLLGYPQPLVRLAREAEAAGWDGFFILTAGHLSAIVQADHSFRETHAKAGAAAG